MADARIGKRVSSEWTDSGDRMQVNEMVSDDIEWLSLHRHA